MDDSVLEKLYDKINTIAINVATLMAKAEEKENRCTDHQKKMDEQQQKINEYDKRMRILELEIERLKALNITAVIERVNKLEDKAASDEGSSSSSKNWKDTLIAIVQTAATVAATVWAVRVG